MDSIFKKVKIRKIVQIYISAMLLTFVILQIPFVKNTYLNNKYFVEIILNILILAWFCLLFSKENVSLKNRIISSIKEVNYKKIFKLYLINVGLYVGSGLYMFIGDKSSIKAPSYMFIILGVTLAPIIEEFIFRGVIMSRLKIKFGTVPAIFVSAVIFGILHFDLNILNCVILHILKNGSVFIFPIISQYTNFSINTDSELKTGIMIIIIFSCFALSIVFNVIYIKNNLPIKNSEFS